MTAGLSVTVRGLGKKYILSHAPKQRYVSLRDVLADGARHLAGRLRHPFAARRATPNLDEFWAIRDIDFDIRPGERVGIIGRNGAGKSTLLKLLSRITDPTTGRIEIRGRVASLLEVGTGFHPELTGRENIFLNGAILGMGRAEIRRKFDEIVAFAGVERFLDTPVKRYSSGMYVRLAFAVAAHLEPDILIVDEVLAVGDAEFQKRCLGKMSEIAGEGRTVLFVSHNMAAMQSLCSRTIYLTEGKIEADGPTPAVVAAYIGRGHKGTGDNARKVHEGLTLLASTRHPAMIRSGGQVDFELSFKAEQPGSIRECAILIHSIRGVRVAILDLRGSGQLPFAYAPGHFSVHGHVDFFPLVEGEYVLGLYLVVDDFAGNLHNILDFEVGPSGVSGDFAPYSPDARGIIALTTRTSIISRSAREPQS